ncbi:MAG TPA: hypothetical protein VF940_14860, partial [Streptosporangiaceae bacterium]
GAEDGFRLHRPVAHLRGWFLRPRARNSATARAATPEIVTPACGRAQPRSRTWPPEMRAQGTPT